jgi:hypothetical protein
LEARHGEAAPGGLFRAAVDQQAEHEQRQERGHPFAHEAEVELLADQRELRAGDHRQRASGKPMASAYQRRGTRQRMMSRSQPRTEPPVTRVTTAAAAAGAKTPTKNGRAAALSSPAIMAGVISVHDMANAKTKNPAVG